MDSDLMQLRIVRRPEVERLTGLSRASLYRLINEGEFPAPVKLTKGNAVGWRERDLREWLASRKPVGGPSEAEQDHLSTSEQDRTSSPSGPAQ